MSGNNQIESSIKLSVLTLIVVVLSITIFYFGWFYIYLDRPLSEDTSSWGTFGDFIGGILNPLVASFALYWLVISVRLQKQELSETRKELTKTAEAQEKLARMQLYSSEISGWNVRLENVLCDLKSVREDLNFIRDSIKDQYYCNLQGKRTNSDTAESEIQKLENRESMLNSMRKTIDSRIEELLLEVNKIQIYNQQ